MKLRMITEGRERADAVRADIKSGKHSFRYLAKKYGVSIPYISACARRIGLGRRTKSTTSSTGTHGLRPGPLLTKMPNLGIVRH